MDENTINRTKAAINALIDVEQLWIENTPNYNLSIQELLVLKKGLSGLPRMFPGYMRITKKECRQLKNRSRRCMKERKESEYNLFKNRLTRLNNCHTSI